MGGISVHAYLELTNPPSDLTVGAANDQMIQSFADALICWNLEDDSGPVPATLEGVRSQDVSLIFQLIAPWIEAVSAVDTPLQQNSNGSKRLDPEELLALGSQSGSLPS